VVKFFVGLSEYSFHAHELDCSEKFVSLPLLNEDKAFTQLGSLVVKFSVGFSEHSFHAHGLDSTKKFVPIPLLNEDKAKNSCGVRTEIQEKGGTL
jgi:hypothetical protein